MEYSEVLRPNLLTIKTDSNIFVADIILFHLMI